MSENKEQKINEELDNDQFSEVLQKDFEFTPSGLCHYKQRGPYLVCVTCEVQHAVWVGMDKMMIGEDDMGKPILKSRTF